MFEVVHNPGPFLSSIALLYTLSIAGATVVTIDYIEYSVFDVRARIGVAILAAILVLVAQALGRRLATIRPERVAGLLYSPMRGLGMIIAPIIWPFYKLVDVVLSGVFRVHPDAHLSTTEEDLRTLVDAVEETEALEEDEREMITSIFE